MIHIQELTQCTDEVFEEVLVLMRQLSTRCVFTPEKLRDLVADANSRLYGMRDVESGRLIGCATLCIFHSPTGRKASIEDVVVLDAYRGQHLGRRLVEHLLDVAKALRPIEVHLTSNPKRVAANGLYQSLGFEHYATNFYRMVVD